MRSDLLLLAGELVERGEPFVLAIVVRREPASSAQAGDMALVTAAGAFHGWLGGSCTQPTVIREARRAMADGVPRLIALSPDPESQSRPGVAAFPMTCHSGGSVEIYLEPVLPRPRLLVFGVSPVAQALARLGKSMGYAVDAVDEAADRAAFPEADRVITELDPAELGVPPPERLFAGVATMGQNDEQATLAALALEPAYLGVIASRARFAQIRTALLARGVPAESLARIRSPAGIDIGAHTPEEIALSIFAEIVQLRRTQKGEQQAQWEEVAARQERDPICGMWVEVDSASHRAEYRGRTYYFCCDGCRERFVADPESFAVPTESGAAG